MWKITYSNQAVKSLSRMPRNTAVLIRSKLKQLAEDPAAMSNIKKLTDHPGYRLRVGDWRIIYLQHEDRLLIEVIKIAPRGGAYQ